MNLIVLLVKYLFQLSPYISEHIFCGVLMALFALNTSHIFYGNGIHITFHFEHRVKYGFGKSFFVKTYFK